jgi:hypothetical protein
MLARFKVLCGDESLTFRAIRDLMNVEFDTDLTRNACIGKARRLAMPPRDPVNNPTLKKELPAVVRFLTFPILPDLPPRSTEPFTLTIDQLRTHDCRWPSDEPRPPFTYCGCKALTGLPYCVKHTRLARSGLRGPKPHP